jgi:hypothetical protein
MAAELKLKTPGIDRYSIITLIFFIPYVLFQPPATVVMRKIGPRIFLSVITLLWGAVMIVRTFPSLSTQDATNIYNRASDSSRTGLR